MNTIHDYELKAYDCLGLRVRDSITGVWYRIESTKGELYILVPLEGQSDPQRIVEVSRDRLITHFQRV